MTEAERRDIRLQQERKSSFIATVQVPIKSLTFDYADTRLVYLKNVERLERVFKLQGCLRRETQHFLVAVIDPATEEFLNAHRESEVVQFAPGKVHCLFGQHRILAAKKHYKNASDIWWTANLYREGMSEQSKRAFGEIYDNAKNFSDGEILRYIRLCERKNDTEGIKKWSARLTCGKTKQVAAFSRMIAYRNAFDDLLGFPGLWASIKLGAFGRVRSLGVKCEEEVVNYLSCIRNTWDKIIKDCDSVIVDSRTAAALQGLCPSLSTSDRKTIQDGFASQKLFAGVTDPDLRLLLQAQTLNTEGMIPTIFTFLEDLKYLEVCVKSISILLPEAPHDLRGLLFDHFSPAEAVKIQTNDNELQTTKNFEGLTNHFSCSYLQLWLYAMRHFPELCNHTPLKECKQRKPQDKLRDPWIVYNFAKLAFECGFRCQEITSLLKQDPAVKASIDLLDGFSHEYEHDAEQLHTAISELASKITESKNELATRIRGNFFTHLPVTEEDVQRRIGLPFQNLYMEIKRHLFLPNIILPQSTSMNSIEAKRQFLRRFFGRDLTILENTSSQNVRSSNSSEYSLPSMGAADHAARYLSHDEEEWEPSEAMSLTTRQSSPSFLDLVNTVESSLSPPAVQAPDPEGSDLASITTNVAQLGQIVTFVIYTVGKGEEKKTVLKSQLLSEYVQYSRFAVRNNMTFTALDALGTAIPLPGEHDQEKWIESYFSKEGPRKITFVLS